MQFSFTVGVNEQHRVDFSFDQFIGNLEIRIDGQPVVKDFRMLSLRLTKRYEFSVGVNEKHHRDRDASTIPATEMRTIGVKTSSPREGLTRFIARAASAGYRPAEA